MNLLEVLLVSREKILLNGLFKFRKRQILLRLGDRILDFTP